MDMRQPCNLRHCLTYDARAGSSRRLWDIPRQCLTPSRMSALHQLLVESICNLMQSLLRQVEELIENTLTQCAKDGFSESAIEAALNTTEFHLRENNTGRFPRGLSLMLRAMGNWIYDKDPYEALQWTEPLTAFKVRQQQQQH